ncbi:histidine kinase dimerization/phosphoacceptor domain -containing protein [Methanobacterium sp. MBAC-LM]|uniref:histidine kinase dimerization/phosphoacceptor domain -containing protein n=1 Tax=Methanobacterium sp. MBAC-LM TaxID=3412034 RepID=UPI003C7859D6
MNIYALVSLLSSILCIFLANFIYYKNTKSKLNQLTALMCFMLAYLLFLEFGYRQAETYYVANLWYIGSFIWIISASLILHVVLVVTDRLNSENKLKILSLVYVPSIIVSIYFVISNLTSVNMVREYWGWTYSVQLNPLLFGLSDLWLTALIVTSLVLAYLHYRKSDTEERKLAKYLILGLSFTMAIGIATDVMSSFSIKIPETFYTAAVLGIALLCYGIVRYRLPQLTPAMAADEIVSAMSNFSVLIDNENRIKNVNSIGLKLLGYRKSEIYGKDMKMIFSEDLSAFKVYKATENCISNFETIMRAKDGKAIPVLMSIAPISYGSHKLGILCVGSDITKIRQKELHKNLLTQQIIERQETLLDLSQKDLSNMPEGLQKITEASFKTVNVDRVSIWLFDFDKTKIICQDCYDGKSHDQGLILEAAKYPRYFEAMKKFHNVTAANAQGYYYTSELNESYFKPNGICSLMDVPIWLEGELMGVLCHETFKTRHWKFEEQDFVASLANLISLGLEASKRKKAEEDLKASLKEKEILMKEIHHRAKNNLTIISSLLNLQSRHINDKEALGVFRESQNRARSMALIHEKLYRSDDLRKIDFGEYIRSLTIELFNSYRASQGIELNMDIDNIDLDINTAVPLALIVNEIVTNSLKYAFPDKKTGNVSVHFAKNSDEMQLIVEDNGIGFPGDLDFRNTNSLGMQLVTSLTDQIKGSIRLERDEGTKFIIDFKEKLYNN